MNTLKINMRLNVPSSKGSFLLNPKNFMNEYVKRYGNVKFLSLCFKYGSLLSNIEVFSFNNEIDDQQKIEKMLRESIKARILGGYFSYQY